MAGKPKKPSEVKGFMLRVRLTEQDRGLIEAAAKLNSLGVSSWARSELVRQARKALGKK